MSDIKIFRDIIAWQKAMHLVVTVHRTCGALPKDERFGLESQIKRAAVSIPSNIAEGHGRSSRTDYIRFLYISKGSLNELETRTEIARAVGYFEPKSHGEILNEIHEVQRLLSALIRALEK